MNYQVNEGGLDFGANKINMNFPRVLEDTWKQRLAKRIVNALNGWTNLALKQLQFYQAGSLKSLQNNSE